MRKEDFKVTDRFIGNERKIEASLVDMEKEVKGLGYDFGVLMSITVGGKKLKSLFACKLKTF